MHIPFFLNKQFLRVCVYVGICVKLLGLSSACFSIKITEKSNENQAKLENKKLFPLFHLIITVVVVVHDVYLFIY